MRTGGMRKPVVFSAADLSVSRTLSQAPDLNGGLPDPVLELRPAPRLIPPPPPPKGNPDAGVEPGTVNRRGPLPLKFLHGSLLKRLGSLLIKRAFPSSLLIQ